MPLRLLLDEHISPDVAEQVQRHRPEIEILSIRHWRDGEFCGVADHNILMAANEDALTFVTYDKRILVELDFIFKNSEPFSGLIFIDRKTVDNDNFDMLVKSLINLWDSQHDLDWNSRLRYLSYHDST